MLRQWVGTQTKEDEASRINCRHCVKCGGRVEDCCEFMFFFAPKIAEVGTDLLSVQWVFGIDRIYQKQTVRSTTLLSWPSELHLSEL